MQEFIGSRGRNVEFTLAASVWEPLGSAGAKQLPARTERSPTFHTDGKFSKFQNTNGQEGFLMQQEVCAQFLRQQPHTKAHKHDQSCVKR